VLRKHLELASLARQLFKCGGDPPGAWPIRPISRSSVVASNAGPKETRLATGESAEYQSSLVNIPHKCLRSALSTATY